MTKEKKKRSRRLSFTLTLVLFCNELSHTSYPLHALHGLRRGSSSFKNTPFLTLVNALLAPY